MLVHLVSLLLSCLFLASGLSVVQTKDPYSLLSWNILAPVFATPDKYFYCDPRFLDWSYRRKKVRDILLKKPSADIICLQEVDIYGFENDIDLPGYTTIVQNVTRGHSVGCAVLVNTTKFQVMQTESRSRALIVILKEKLSKCNQNLFLANVHLEAGYGEDETRFFQIKSLLKRLENQWTKLQSTLSTSSDNAEIADLKNPAIMIVGDFNMLDNNPLFYLLSHGDWEPNATKDLPRKSKNRQFPFLPLKETFHNTQQRIGMSFSGGSVLDYIWHSDQILAEPWIVDAKSLTPGTRQAWPSRDHPSDHLPIGVHFSFR